MDPALDPPPFSAQPTGAADALFPAPAAANPIQAQPVPVNHPNYAEMITAAITALNERDGSSSRAIAKYIETNYQGLPVNHSVQLTDALKWLKDNGQLAMVKKSYALATRSAAAAVNGDVPADPAASGSKRRPGRPPKPKPDAGQAAVPVFAPAPALNMNVEPAAPTVAHIAVAPVRGRGRPPKRGPGRPPQTSGAVAVSVGKPRGRPKKNDAVAPSPAPGRPRGRPPKPINAVQGAPVAAPVPVGGKRRGRPPKAGGVAKKPRNMTAVQPRKHRQLSGKPLGRPKKDAAVALANDTPDAKLLSAYFKLNTVLETLKTKVKDTVIVVRPSLNSDDAITALNELEAVADTVSAPPGAPIPPQQPQLQS